MSIFLESEKLKVFLLKSELGYRCLLSLINNCFRSFSKLSVVYHEKQIRYNHWKGGDNIIIISM